MKVEEIKTIVKLMSEHDLTEFKIEAEEYNLCIKRGSKTAAPQFIQTLTPAPAVQAPQITAAPAAAPVAETAPVSKGVAIESPLVGTFYRSSSPDSAAFVQIGSKVSEDTVVCIIEAMKVMNEVKAEKCGTIKEILVENGQPVEYGQPLFVIE